MQQPKDSCLDALIWELLAWALPKGGDVPTFFGKLATSRGLLGSSRLALPITTSEINCCFENLRKNAKNLPEGACFSPCNDLLNLAPSSAAQHSNRHAGGRHQADDVLNNPDCLFALNPYKRNALRKTLQASVFSGHPPAPPLMHLQYQCPGVWSVRIVPIRLWSMAPDPNPIRSDSEIARRADRRRRERLEQERTSTLSLLAMAYNLQSGGFIYDTLDYEQEEDDGNLSEKQEEDDFRDAEVDTNRVNRVQFDAFMNRFVSSLTQFGGLLALPRRINDLDEHMNQWIIKWCKNIDVPVYEALPCLWPGKSMIEVNRNNFSNYFSYRLRERDPIYLFESTTPVDFTSPDTVESIE